MATLLLSSTAWADIAIPPSYFCKGKKEGDTCTINARLAPKRTGTCQLSTCSRGESSQVDGKCLSCVIPEGARSQRPTSITKFNVLAAGAGPVVLAGLVANWFLRRRKREAK